MNKPIYHLLCIGLILAFLMGCSNNSVRNTSINKNTHTVYTPSQLLDTIDLEPTPHITTNNLNHVVMRIKEGSTTPTALTIIFENNSENSFIYGDYYTIEREINNAWYQVPVAIEENYGFNDIGYELAPQDTPEWVVDWEWLYGNLQPGEYRIIKDLLDNNSSASFNNYYLSAEFTI